jgi:hypothetical protein
MAAAGEDHVGAEAGRRRCARLGRGHCGPSGGATTGADGAGAWAQLAVVGAHALHCWNYAPETIIFSFIHD